MVMIAAVVEEEDGDGDNCRRSWMGMITVVVEEEKGDGDDSGGF